MPIRTIRLRRARPATASARRALAARVLLALAVMATGCALRAEDPPDSPGIPVDATVGQRFTLSLESKASTGYRWYLDDDPDPNVVRVVSSEYRASAEPLLGAPGTEVWTFDAFGPGTATLSFVYRRPFGHRDSAPGQRRRYTVRVRAAR